MPLHDALDRRQPDPYAGELLLRVQTLKGAEEFIRVRHVESCPVVPDKVGSLRRSLGEPELHLRPGALSRELPRISEEVFQDNSQERRIALGGDAFGDDAFNLSLRITLPELLYDFPGAGAQVHDFASQLGTREAGEVQESIDQLPHPNRRRADPPQ